MKNIPFLSWAALSLGLATACYAQTGPFDPEDWPTTRKADATVHYVVTDGGITAPSGTWQEGALTILSGGDQVTADFTIGGHTGKKVTAAFLKRGGQQYAEWADDEFIDILVQAYGDDALFMPKARREFHVPAGHAAGTEFSEWRTSAVEAKIKRWNWICSGLPMD